MTRAAKGWTLAATTLFVVVIGTVVPESQWDRVFQAVERLQFRRAEIVPVLPAVLLVSAQESDRFIVRLTVEPRGYQLMVAESALAAGKVLEAERQRIAVVVVDRAVSASGKLIRAIKLQCPDAYVVELHGRREATQLSALLTNRVLN